MTVRSGIGFDVHPLMGNRTLILGGVQIPFEKGLVGHSDGDVLIHAVIDALLGGAGLGDIGTHFPSNDSRYEGIASTKLLTLTLKLLQGTIWQATYVDATILAQDPALSPYMKKINRNLAKNLCMPSESVNLKAKTTDGLGFVGRGEGIAVMAVATLDSR